jgi:hypothetical protein
MGERNLFIFSLETLEVELVVGHISDEGSGVGLYKIAQIQNSLITRSL